MNDYCYWLLPSKEDKNYLQKIVTELAKNHKAIPFIPHVTLYPIQGIPKEKSISILQESIKDISPFHICTDRVFYSKDFFKTVFIEFTMNEQLRLIHKRLQNTLHKVPHYKLNPHISLLYKDYSIEKKQEIAESIDVKDSFLMDTVVLVDLGSEDISQIENWKIVFNQNLQ